MYFHWPVPGVKNQRAKEEILQAVKKQKETRVENFFAPLATI